MVAEQATAGPHLPSAAAAATPHAGHPASPVGQPVRWALVGSLQPTITMRLALCKTAWLPATTALRTSSRKMGLGGSTRAAAGPDDQGSGQQAEGSPQQTAAPPPPAAAAAQQQEQQPFRILSEQVVHQRYLTLYNCAVQFPAEDGGPEVGRPQAPPMHVHRPRPSFGLPCDAACCSPLLLGE